MDIRDNIQDVLNIIRFLKRNAGTIEAFYNIIRETSPESPAGYKKIINETITPIYEEMERVIDYRGNKLMDEEKLFLARVGYCIKNGVDFIDKQIISKMTAGEIDNFAGIAINEMQLN